MIKNIKDAIQEFKLYSTEYIYTIDQIKSWLDQQDDLYEYAKLNWNAGSCCGSLPCGHTLNNELSSFINFHDALKEIVEVHDYEAYFWQALEEYQLIKDNQLKLKEWVKRNERLGSKEFICFFPRYLDYSVNPYHLKVFVSDFHEFEIYVNRNCFLNTIAFIEIFDKLFWEDEILPESIKAIEEEINNLRVIEDDSSD